MAQITERAIVRPLAVIRIGTDEHGWTLAMIDRHQDALRRILMDLAVTNTARADAKFSSRTSDQQSLAIRNWLVTKYLEEGMEPEHVDTLVNYLCYSEIVTLERSAQIAWRDLLNQQEAAYRHNIRIGLLVEPDSPSPLPIRNTQEGVIRPKTPE